MQAHVVGLEADLPSGGEARRDEVFHDLVLTVHRNGSTACQLGERDAMPFALELQVDAVVHEPLAIHSLADVDGSEEIDGPLLEYTCAQSFLDICAVAALDDNGVDAATMKQVAECEPGRPGADDRDLRASSLSCHTKKLAERFHWPSEGVRCRLRRMRLMTHNRSSVSEARMTR